jgi:group II intron reverse transcriptase/maturase
MLPAIIMKRLEALAIISKQGKRLNGLLRLMEDPILWHEAYANIYANEGATTPGIDEVTLDGFSQERVRAIITRLKDGTYRFKPTRRTYIPEKSGKKRPLGISSGDDKLVQEVVRIILERIYEPIFEESSHGFRPDRSPHTALQYIDRQGDGVKWWIDMDIRDYFTTINHDLLIQVLQRKIEDKRFLRLRQAMLKAGYLEDWTFHTTYSGVPQGSICAPILANVYLHELDCFMKTVQDHFRQGKERRPNKVYEHYSRKIYRLRKKYDTLKGKGAGKEQLQEVQRAIKSIQQLRRNYPSGDPFDPGFRRLQYCRFADDFIIGIILCESLIFLRTGALRSYDSARRIKQCILHALAMFGECITREVTGRKIAALPGLFGWVKVSTGNAAAERQHNLLFLWLGIDAYQLFYISL